LESEAFNESEMALFSECRPQRALTVLDTADIVRDGDVTTVMDGALPQWDWHDMQDRSRSSSISGQTENASTRPNVLEHFLENRKTVECISQFAMLLRVRNRQSP
jgi:hypothetical protein